MDQSLKDKKAKAINLRVLQRRFSGIKDILLTCKYTTLYLFDSAGKVWHKLNICGPLFFCSMIGKQETKLVIMSQNSQEDFSIDNLDREKIELNINQKMLYFKDSEGITRGIWIFDEDGLVRLADCIKGITPKPSNQIYYPTN